MPQQVLLFHSYGSYHDSKWVIKLKGWTFQTNSNSKRSNILRSISRRMLSPINGSTEHQRLVFDTRTEGLLSSVLPKCACTVAIISQKRPLIFKSIEEEDEAELNEFRNLDKGKLKHGGFPNVKVVSDENGLFNVTFELSEQDLEQFGAVVGEQGVRIFAYIQDSMDEAHSFSYCPFISPKGVSIISDVDDTIKESSVHKGIIAATKVALFEDMKDVPGMVDCYNMLSAKGFGMHYVSAGPFQLLPVLQTFLETFRFPLGSLMLRNTYLQTAVDYKINVVLEILRDFPERKFILIGDSGERDIEIYEKVRDHAHDQILKVFIRDVGANQSVADLEIRARKRVSAVSVQSTSTTGSIRTWMGFSSTTAVTEQLSINDADTHKRWRLFKDPTEIILDSDVREYLTTQYRGDLQAAAANFDEESEEDVVPIVVNSVDRPVHVVVNDTKVAETVLANVVSEAFELQEETIELGEPSNTETVPALDEMNLEEIMGEIAELKGH